MAAEPANASASSPAARHRWTFLLPLLYGAVVFAPMLRNQFWRDDYGWVSRAMSTIRDPALVLELSKTDFRPLPGVSFVLNFLLSGLNPAGYYLVNLLIHLVNVALVVALARRLTRSAAGAIVAGLLFAGGCFNYGEAVIWISGRTGLFADGFVLAALLLHARHLEGGRTRDLALSGACFVLALLSKESAVVLLLLMGLVEWTLGRAPGVAPARRRYLPLAAVLVAYLVFEFAAFRRGSAELGTDYAIGFHAARNLLEYLARLFLPLTPSSMILGVPPGVQPLLHGAMVALMVVVPLVMAWLLVGPFPRPVKLGVLWVLVTLLPYVFLTFRTITRYLYLPSVGVALVVAALAASHTGGERARRGAAMRLGLAALLVLQAVVVNVVIFQRLREQRIQDGAAARELAEQARRLGLR